MTTDTTDSSHSLPAIPTLPPIQMPRPQDDSDYVTSIPQHSTPATPSSPVLTQNQPHAGGPSTTDSDQQQIHRKSASADSLRVHQRKDSVPPSPRGAASATLPTADLSTTRRTETVPPYARSRGHSVSTTSDGNDSGIDQGLEPDSWPPLKRSLDKGRRSSVKGGEQARPSRRPGDLKLPSRNQQPPLPFTFVQTLPRDDNRRLHSTTSLQSFPKHSSITEVMSGRVRSGSLGLQGSAENSGSRPLHIDTTQPALHSREFLLAVVGTRGCGKSTFVAEDAQSHGLDNFDALFNAPDDLSVSPFCYARKSEWSKRESLYHLIRVYELDITRITALPPVNGIFVCYDSADASSFAPVPDFLRSVTATKHCVVAIALKSDLEPAVDRHNVAAVDLSDAGRIKMRKAFGYMLRSLAHAHNVDLGNSTTPDVAGPTVLWESRGSMAVTRTPSSALLNDTASQDRSGSFQLSPTANLPMSIPPSASSPTRARSTSDLRVEHEKTKSQDLEERRLSSARSTNNLAAAASSQIGTALSLQRAGDLTNGHDEEERQLLKEKETRSAQYVTVEELLDKLLFLAVSGDDPTFISQFLLTYRRFASPRSVLLAMQKRLRELDKSLGDSGFVGYAEMRICHLLQTWIDCYPQDFAVPGTSGALSALVKSILRKIHLCHYGTDFLPFLEHISNVSDVDAAWAQKAEPLLDDSDDSYCISDGEDDTLVSSLAVESASASASKCSVTQSYENSIGSSSRERKQSLPLSAKALIMPVSPPVSDSPDIPPKQLLKELAKYSQELQNYDCSEIAEEITRVEATLFLAIMPRDWLRFTFVPGRKDPEADSIARFNAISNYLADWVVSLILCHDKPRNRAKQIEKFVDIAHKLRALNNYSALRAFVAGINNSTFQGDDTMETFKSKYPDHYKNLLSWDVLLQHRGAHQAYRMALKNTKGACIPALEVHMSDLIRAHEGNPDFSRTEPKKIHWGKFSMLGRFIQCTTQCQIQCQTTSDYNFRERHKIRDLVFNAYVMSIEVSGCHHCL
ncbi:ras guanine nucleotide exchange factor domain-containing protein [Pisolithus microcarpus]|nr:ras guanine nucleotide exchange factor domain-containing protein [Pisolithus microcarpus]